MNLKPLALVWASAAAIHSPLASAKSDPALAALLSRWDQDDHHDLKGVIVLRDGRIIAERYFNGDTPATLHDIRSAGKSITALLTGIAIDARMIRSLDDRVDVYWPQAKGSAIADVPLRDVLTMRSGLAAFDDDPSSPGQENRLDAAADPSAFIRALPREAPPGSIYRYNSATASVAGIVVANAARRPLAAFAGERLFTPLGITRWQWEQDRAGYFKGQGNLSITLRAFATIGEMVRGGGVYHGRRVVSQAWIDQALAGKATISDVDPYADQYGYFWYGKTQTIAGQRVRVSFASGNGGNKIYLVPSRHLVVAITSSAYGRSYGQRRSEEILKAILATDLSGSGSGETK